MLLWHGTKVDSNLIIEGEQGFDCRFAKNGVHGYGNYFAIHASYCVNSGFYKDEGAGVRGVFLVRVLVGHSVSGRSQSFQNRPPMKPDGVTPYDSVTDRTKMYVVYSNEKAYPAYYVKYRQ